MLIFYKELHKVVRDHPPFKVSFSDMMVAVEAARQRNRVAEGEVSGWMSRMTFWRYQKHQQDCRNDREGNRIHVGKKK